MWGGAPSRVIGLGVAAAEAQGYLTHSDRCGFHWDLTKTVA